MRPLLIIFAGKAGTGKTTMAVSVSMATGFAYLDYDTLVQPFLQRIEDRFGLEGDDRYGFYRIWREPCYKTLIDTATENLKLGHSVIISAPLSSELLDEHYPEKLRREAGVDFDLLLCYMAPPSDLHYGMMEQRGSVRDEDFIGDRSRFDSCCGSVRPLWKEDMMVLDSGDFELNRRLIIDKLNHIKEFSK